MTKQSNCGEMLLFWGIQVKGTWQFVIQLFVQCCNFSVSLKYFQIISKTFKINAVIIIIISSVQL